MKSQKLKDDAHRLVDSLPDEASWDDLMNEIYIRQSIEAGLNDSEAGNTVDVKEIRARYKLPE